MAKGHVSDELKANSRSKHKYNTYSNKYRSMCTNM